MSEHFEKSLVAFLLAVQNASDDYYASKFPTLAKPVFTVERGKRYVRVVRIDAPGQRCVHCFIDTTDGSILKPASWKGPARGIRGFIYDATPPVASYYAGGTR